MLWVEGRALPLWQLAIAPVMVRAPVSLDTMAAGRPKVLEYRLPREVVPREVRRWAPVSRARPQGGPAP